MFRPTSLFIGLRYTRAKSRNRFISLISLASTLGIALGVTVLITVLSVINGFDKEIKRQIFAMISPITLISYQNNLEDWNKLESYIKTLPGITGVAPFVSNQAMLTNSNLTLPVMMVGVLPDEENKVSALSEKVVKGNLQSLRAGQFGIVIGSTMAKNLNVDVGDNLTIATLKNSFSTSNVTPNFKKFTVVGIFKAGGGALNFDSRIAFINLNDAQRINHLDQAISGFHINIDDIYMAPDITMLLQNQLPSDLRVWDWTEQLGEFFDNIRLTKTIMFFIFLLIIAVAAFNLICTMVMVVKNKQSDIAILRTLGATPGTILSIFIIQGTATAFVGTLLGVLGGLSLAWNITAISTSIQTALHTELISSNIYFINYLPSELKWFDVGIISLVAMLLGLIATLYPAWNASRLEPVEVLNSE